jgi:cell division protein FtsB
LRLIRLPQLASGPVQMILAVAALLFGLFVYSLLQTTQSSVRLGEHERALQAEVAMLSREKADLEGLRAYLATDEYIEAVARSEFGLVRRGEIAVTVQAPPEPESRVRVARRWWQELFTP